MKRLKLYTYITALHAALLCILLAASPAGSGSMTLLGAGKAAAGGGGCSQATAFLARTSGLDGTHTTAYTNLICGLVTDGVFANIDALYVFATQDSATALLNLVQNAYNPTIGAPTVNFSADNGFTSNGFGFLDTGFNPTTATTPNFTQNSAHFAAWNLTNATPNGGLIGNTNASASWQFFGGASFPRVNDTGGSFSLVDPRGFLLANRTVSTDRQASVNGSQVDTQAVGSTATVNANFAVCAYSTTGGFITNQIAAATIGGGLSGTQITNLYGRLRTYMTAVGVP